MQQRKDQAVLNFSNLFLMSSFADGTQRKGHEKGNEKFFFLNLCVFQGTTFKVVWNWIVTSQVIKCLCSILLRICLELRESVIWILNKVSAFSLCYPGLAFSLHASNIFLMSSFAHGIVCTGKATKKSNLTFQTFVKSVCVFSLFVFAKFVFMYLWKLNDKGDLTFQMFVSSPNNAGPRQARRLFWPARHLSPVHHQCHHVTPDQTLSNRHDSVPPAQLNSAEHSWT